MAKRDYFQEVTDIYRDVIKDLTDLIKDEINVEEKYLYAIANGSEIDEVKINRVYRENDILLCECRSLSSDENYVYQLDELDINGLINLLDNILVDDCEPECYDWC